MKAVWAWEDQSQRRCVWNAALAPRRACPASAGDHTRSVTRAGHGPVVDSRHRQGDNNRPIGACGLKLRVDVCRFEVRRLVGGASPGATRALRVAPERPVLCGRQRRIQRNPAQLHRPRAELGRLDAQPLGAERRPIVVDLDRRGVAEKCGVPARGPPAHGDADDPLGVRAAGSRRRVVQVDANDRELDGLCPPRTVVVVAVGPRATVRRALVNAVEAEPLDSRWGGHCAGRYAAGERRGRRVAVALELHGHSTRTSASGSPAAGCCARCANFRQEHQRQEQ